MEIIPPIIPVLPMAPKIKPDSAGKSRGRKPKAPTKPAFTRESPVTVTQPIDEIV